MLNIFRTPKILNIKTLQDLCNKDSYIFFFLPTVIHNAYPVTKNFIPVSQGLAGIFPSIFSSTTPTVPVL